MRAIHVILIVVIVAAVTTRLIILSAERRLVRAAVPAAAPAPRPAPAAKPSRPETRFTFDPKLATVGGGGGFAWGLGSLSVTFRGHRAGFCDFDYRFEIEQPNGDYQVYRVSVPLDSGLVVIDAGRNDHKNGHNWSYVYTSFTAEQATLVRRRREFGWFVDPLAGTSESVTHRLLHPGDPNRPLAGGTTAIVRFQVYLHFANDQFREQWQQQSAVVPLTGETQWNWAQHVLAEMNLYEIRQVRLPARIGGPAAGWLPGYNENSEILVEMVAVAVERK